MICPYDTRKSEGNLGHDDNPVFQSDPAIVHVLQPGSKINVGGSGGTIDCVTVNANGGVFYQCSWFVNGEYREATLQLHQFGVLLPARRLRIGFNLEGKA